MAIFDKEHDCYIVIIGKSSHSIPKMKHIQKQPNTEGKLASGKLTANTIVFTAATKIMQMKSPSDRAHPLNFEHMSIGVWSNHNNNVKFMVLASRAEYVMKNIENQCVFREVLGKRIPTS